MTPGRGRARLLRAALDVLERLAARFPASGGPPEGWAPERPLLAKALAGGAQHRAQARHLAEVRQDVLRELRRDAVAAREALGPNLENLAAMAEALEGREGAWLALYERLYRRVGGEAGRELEAALGTRKYAPVHRGTPEYAPVHIAKAPPPPWLGAVLGFLRREGGARITDIRETTRDRIRGAIVRGVREGETVQAIAGRLEAAVASPGRALLIARNETLLASAVGTHAAAEASGLEIMQTWTAQRDDRVRPAHRAANGQRRRLGQPFLVAGERLRFPGDPALGASPDNTIQCRCVALMEPVAPRPRAAAQPARRR